jgi:hypothetical protein
VDGNAFGECGEFFCQGFDRGFPSEGFAGSFVHESGDAVEVLLGLLGKVRAFGQELAQEAVGIFVRAALPGMRRNRKQSGGLFSRRMMGVAEPDIELQAAGQLGVAGHLQTAIVGEASAQARGQTPHLAGEALQRSFGAVAFNLGENDKAGLALDQGAKRGAVEGALDQIALPVAGDQAPPRIGALADLRAIARPRSGPLPPPRQLAADRARRTAQKPGNLPLARAPKMLRNVHERPVAGQSLGRCTTSHHLAQLRSS